MTQSFRNRLLSGEQLIGTWIKTPSAIVCDLLARTPLDTLCLDAEHAPFDRLMLDSCVNAMQAQQMPSLIRVPSASAEGIQNALDIGATGVVVPHVDSVAVAERIAKASRFGAGGRGYAGSTRAAGYTLNPMADNLARSREETCVIAQIEDLEALSVLDDIAAVAGIDCLFVGRIDLTVALGADSPNAPEVIEAVEAICAAGQKAGRSVGMFVGNIDEVPRWQKAGANFFLLNSDHGFMLSGAKQLKTQFAQFQ